jgi:pimeloyl-[acyl-carrier protein] methyl ester esterase
VLPITLVLLPGLDGTGELFANLLRELPPSLSVVPLAYPAERFLPYSELVTWLRERVPRNGAYVLLGESYGSPLAVQFAATRPPNLVGLILCVGFISNPVKHWAFLPRLLARPFFFRFRPPDIALEFFITGFNAPRSLKDAVNRATSSVSPQVLAARARATLDCDARDDIQRVQVPMLYLQASQDRLVGKYCLDEIKRLRPDVTSISFRAPHLLFQRQPRATAAAIMNFIEAQCQQPG